MSNLYNQSLMKPNKPQRDASAVASRTRDASGNNREAEAYAKGSAQNSAATPNGNNHAMASEHEVTPIIFEECYVKNDDFRFV